MPLSCLPALLARCFARLATALDRRSALRLPLLCCGLLFASGRRTCTAWFRAAGITAAYRRASHALGATGRGADRVAARLLPALEPMLPGDRLLVALDDTPTPRC